MVRRSVPQHYRLDQWHSGDTLELDWILTESETDSELPTLLLHVNRVPDESDADNADLWGRSSVLSEETAFIKFTESKRRDGDQLFITVIGHSDKEARYELVLDRGGEREVVPVTTVEYVSSLVRIAFFVGCVAALFGLYSIRRRFAAAGQHKRSF